MATHSSILAWKISWTEEPVSCSPWGHKESGMTERLTLTYLLTAFKTLVYYDGYTISSKGFLPTVVDIMLF